jgi:tetratricopeptide (TPR) repeat protein
VGRREDDGTQKTARFSDDQERRTAKRPSRPQPWARDDGSKSEWRDTPLPAAKRRAAASGAPVGAPGPPLAPRKPLPVEIAADIRKAASIATALHRERLVEKTESAYGAYSRGRYQDAYRAIKPVADEVPTVAAVREVAGLAAYRSGKWREAQRHLQAHMDLTDSGEHLPVLMDCQRALRKPKKVADLWAELRQRSPEPDVLAEGRLVAAASLAETGNLPAAISMLSGAGATKALRNPSNRHIRQWYLLADLYERAGDVPRAREFFERVAKVDREAYDVMDRLASLGPQRKVRTRPRPTTR